MSASTANSPAARSRLAEEISRAWPLAQASWSRFLLLSDPVGNAEQPSVAQINLSSRQVSLNWERILEKDLVECVEALLAHEVGHHVRYPGTLQVHARLRLLERSLLPFDDYSLINLFTDFMINERIGLLHREQLVRAYRAFSGDPEFHREEKWRHDPVFLFYLSLYEALWRLEPGTVMGPAEKQFVRHFSQYRAEAEVLVHNLLGLTPNLYTQFLYFLSIAVRYLKPLRDERPVAGNPNGCGNGEPSPGDWADALQPTARELEAIERAIREGWFTKDQADRLGQLNDVDSRIAGLPGTGTDDARQIPEVMAAYYRQQAEAYLFRPPPQPRLGEAVVPTTLEEWEPSSGARSIDWLATLSLRGEEFGSAQPLMRTSIAELEGFDTPLWQPRMEIYLDVSGSMPNPCVAVNAMTLAAQILTLGTVRAGGWVRSLLYSGAPVSHWEWCRSELEMSQFLMHYIGGGTEFPFEILSGSLRECAREQPIRVIISDCDFNRNFEAEPAARQILSQAAELSPHFILLQHMSDSAAGNTYRELGVQVVNVADWQDFPRMARDLAWSLFPEGEHGVV